MSALFNATSKYLSATLASSIDVQTTRSGLSYWVRWISGQTHNSSSYAACLAEASTTNLVGAYCDSAGPKMVGIRNYGSNLTIGAGANLPDDTWKLVVVHAEVDATGASRAITLWYDNATLVQNGNTPAGTSNDFTRIFIGQSPSVGAFSNWKGYVAEAAVWRDKTQAQMTAIRDNLLLYYADANFPDHQPSEYWPILSDTTAVTGGVNLTNNGTTTFDAGVHPTLTSFSGGGGGSVIISSCLMRGESPNHQARRLGFSGWQGVVGL